MKSILKPLPVLFLIYTVLLHAQAHLPVQLVYFKYELSDSTVNLSWGTATEVQCYGFNVERYSSSNWETIGFVPGHGDSNIPWDYSLADTDVVYGNTYLYRLKQIDLNGQYIYSDTLSVSVITGLINIGKNFPSNFSVSQNYPNPFNPSTNIDVQIPESGKLMLRVYNISGRLVFIKDYGQRFSGEYTVSFNGSNLSSGVYFYTISAGRFKLTRSMILIK